MATSTEEAIRGSAFRMSVRLMPCVTFDELLALQRLCTLQRLPVNDVTLLKQLLSLANPTCIHTNDSKGDETGLEYAVQAVTHSFETKSLPVQLESANRTPFDVQVAGSTLFSLLGCASADKNVSTNPLLSLLEPLQLLHITEAPKTFYGAFPPHSSGRSSASEELSIMTKPPEVTDNSTATTAIISPALGTGDSDPVNDEGRKRITSCSSSDQSLKSTKSTVDSISRVKHYCDRHGLRHFYLCAQVADCLSPHFKADLTVDRAILLKESLHSHGYGRTKKSARHNAAFNMLEQLEMETH
ncbi:unnamed protein product, partial [Allacma fusca]